MPGSPIWKWLSPSQTTTEMHCANEYKAQGWTQQSQGEVATAFNDRSRARNCNFTEEGWEHLTHRGELYKHMATDLDAQPGRKHNPQARVQALLLETTRHAGCGPLAVDWKGGADNPVALSPSLRQEIASFSFCLGQCPLGPSTRGLLLLAPVMGRQKARDSRHNPRLLSLGHPHLMEGSALSADSTDQTRGPVWDRVAGSWLLYCHTADWPLYLTETCIYYGLGQLTSPQLPLPWVACLVSSEWAFLLCPCAQLTTAAGILVTMPWIAMYPYEVPL